MAERLRREGHRPRSGEWLREWCEHSEVCGLLRVCPCVVTHMALVRFPANEITALDLPRGAARRSCFA